MKIKINSNDKTIQIISAISVKEFITLAKTVDINSYVLIPYKFDTTHNLSLDNIKILKNEGFTNKDIAKELNTSERTIYRKLNKIK